MDVLIFGGQSNMQGQSECLSNTDTVENAFEYKWFPDALVPLKNPVGENIAIDFTEGYPLTKEMGMGQELIKWLNSHLAGGSVYGCTNLVPEFCRAYTEKSHRRAVAVHVAKGSSVIAQWHPDSLGFQAIVKKASAAIEKVKKEEAIDKIYFIWLQGESDALARSSKAYYKDALINLKNALKKALNIDKFGIIRVGRFVGDARDDEIIDAQREACLEDDDFVMLTEIAEELFKMPEYMNPDVPGHFSALGLEKLGFEAGSALAEC